MQCRRCWRVKPSQNLMHQQCQRVAMTTPPPAQIIQHCGVNYLLSPIEIGQGIAQAQQMKLDGVQSQTPLNRQTRQSTSSKRSLFNSPCGSCISSPVGQHFQLASPVPFSSPMFCCHASRTMGTPQNVHSHCGSGTGRESPTPQNVHSHYGFGRELLTPQNVHSCCGSDRESLCNAPSPVLPSFVPRHPSVKHSSGISSETESECSREVRFISSKKDVFRDPNVCLKRNGNTRIEHDTSTSSNSQPRLEQKDGVHQNSPGPAVHASTAEGGAIDEETCDNSITDHSADDSLIKSGIGLNITSLNDGESQPKESCSTVKSLSSKVGKPASQKPKKPKKRRLVRMPRPDLKKRIKKTKPPPEEKEYHLVDWYLYAFPEKKIIIVEGNKMNAGVVWHSGPVVEVISPHKVKSKNGSVYILHGEMKTGSDAGKGLPVTVLQKFKNGFPKDLSDVTREIFGPTQSSLKHMDRKIISTTEEEEMAESYEPSTSIRRTGSQFSPTRKEQNKSPIKSQKKIYPQFLKDSHSRRVRFSDVHELGPTGETTTYSVKESSTASSNEEEMVARATSKRIERNYADSDDSEESLEERKVKHRCRPRKQCFPIDSSDEEELTSRFQRERNAAESNGIEDSMEENKVKHRGRPRKQCMPIDSTDKGELMTRTSKFQRERNAAESNGIEDSMEENKVKHRGRPRKQCMPIDSTDEEELMARTSRFQRERNAAESNGIEDSIEENKVKHRGRPRKQCMPIDSTEEEEAMTRTSRFQRERNAAESNGIEDSIEENKVKHRGRPRKQCMPIDSTEEEEAMTRTSRFQRERNAAESNGIEDSMEENKVKHRGRPRKQCMPIDSTDEEDLMTRASKFQRERNAAESNGTEDSMEENKVKRHGRSRKQCMPIDSTDKEEEMIVTTTSFQRKRNASKSDSSGDKLRRSSRMRKRYIPMDSVSWDMLRPGQYTIGPPLAKSRRKRQRQLSVKSAKKRNIEENPKYTLPFQHYNTTTDEEEEEEWPERERDLLFEALLSLRKPGRKIWAKVSKKLGGRYTPEECQREHYRSCIKPRTLRHKQKKEERTPSLTAKKGTLKRKTQLRILVERDQLGHKDDIFESTPFKQRRYKAFLSSYDEDSDYGLSDHSVSVTETPVHPMKKLLNAPKQLTPVLCDVLSTPDYRVDNRIQLDKTIYHLQKKSKKQHVNVPGKRKLVPNEMSSGSNALPKTWENKVKKLVQGQQSVLKKINPDFEEDLQDYYFSDDSAADTY